MEIQLTTQHLRASRRGIKQACDVRASDLLYGAFKRLKEAGKATITHNGEQWSLKGFSQAA